MLEQNQTETGCCPRFNPDPWDKKMHEWQEKKFIKDHVVTAFYMPLNFGGVMKRIQGKLRAANATCSEYLCLSDHTSKWNIDVYCATDKEVPNAENVTLSGKFLSKVYEGPFQKTGEWTKDFEKFVSNQGKTLKKMYMWYTTCPKCAKVYGKNYVVIFGALR